MALTERIAAGHEDGLPRVARQTYELLAGCVIVGCLALSIGLGFGSPRGISPAPPRVQLETKIAALHLPPVQVNAPRTAIYGRLARPLRGPAGPHHH
jgi:hypothetical protein